MSNESDDEEFSDFSCSSGHSDIGLVAYITKHLEYVIRKYYCGDLAVSARIPLGRVIRKYSDFRAGYKNLVWSLMTLVEKRNDLVHNIEVDKFESKSDRKHFVEHSNRVLQVLSKKRQPDEFGTLYLTRVVLCSGDVSVDHDIDNYNETKIEIKRPGEFSSDYDMLDYHCWNMIKKDPVLQKSISDDVHGLFEGLLPIPFEEYLSIIPTDVVPEI